MDLSIDRLDLNILGDAGSAILFGECDEVDEWIPVLADELEVSKEDIEVMLDELRIFFALVVVAIKAKVFPPWKRAPTEPPPYLKRLWVKMAANERNYRKFISATDLDERLWFQREYPPERRINKENAWTLRNLAVTVGLPIKEKYWEL